MPIDTGRSYLAIPGPSVVPDRVLRAMHQAAPNIYEGEMAESMPAIVAELKDIAGTSQHLALYIGNGHAAWEAALANTLAQNDVALVLSTGRFAHGWAGMANALGTL